MQTHIIVFIVMGDIFSHAVCAIISYLFACSTHSIIFNILSYEFNESDGEVEHNILRILKQNPSLPTEVDIPVKIETIVGTATAGAGIHSRSECILDFSRASY